MKDTKTRRPRRKILVPKDCFFCKDKKEPNIWETQVLHRFLTEREKIVSRSRSGLCSAHQKAATNSIKHARLLALLPFVARA